MATRRKTRVLLVDDHHQIASSVSRDINRSDRLEIVGTCHNSRTAEAMALIERPNVVLMDVVMPGKSPFESCRRIILETGGQVNVLFWTGFMRTEYVNRCKEAGGSGIVSKGGETFEELVAIIERVARGEQYWSPDWEQRVQEIEAGGGLSPVERLTPREIAVVKRLAAGDTIAEAAAYVELSEPSVKRALATAREKLGCKTTNQLLYVASVECVVMPQMGV